MTVAVTDPDLNAVNMIGNHFVTNGMPLSSLLQPFCRVA